MPSTAHQRGGSDVPLDGICTRLRQQRARSATAAAGSGNRGVRSADPSRGAGDGGRRGGDEGLQKRPGQGARRRDSQQDQGRRAQGRVLTGPRPRWRGGGPRSRPRATIPRVPTTSKELPVAVFDSGVGGLTVLHECLVSLPHEDFLYLGDTARFPYGNRSHAELLAFGRELAGILLDRGAKLIVVACNSATAAALPELREELANRLHVIGVVTPEAGLAAAAT